MEAGKLDRRIRIDTATAVRDPQTRELVRTWLPLATVWAERLPQTGREYYGAQQQVAEINAGWQIRWSSTVAAVTPTEGFRVVADGREYDILDVREADRTRRRALLIFGKARAE